MKVVIAIAVIIASIFSVVTILEAYDIIEIQTSLLDFQENGNSEKDTSENSEDEPEKDSFTHEENPLEDPELSLLNNNILTLSSTHFMDVPVPPPDLI